MRKIAKFNQHANNIWYKHNHTNSKLLLCTAGITIHANECGHISSSLKCISQQLHFLGEKKKKKPLFSVKHTYFTHYAITVGISYTFRQERDDYNHPTFLHNCIHVKDLTHCLLYQACNLWLR